MDYSRLVELLPPDEFDRRMKAYEAGMVRDFTQQGMSLRDARRAARKLMGIFDLMVVDERGWVAFEGLDLPPVPPRRR